MAKKLYEEESIRDIACAIREKCGNESATYKCCDMGDAIRNLTIASDPVIEPLNITANGVYTVPTGVDGYNPITVGVIDGRDKSVEAAIMAKTLSGDYVNDLVIEINSNVFSNCENLISIDLPNCIKIASFSGCENLITANLPNVVDYDNLFGYGHMFSGCPKLTTVNIPKLQLIGEWAFYKCKSLTTMNFPNVIKIFGRGFEGCESLTTINFPNVREIEYLAFYDCKSLVSIYFPNVETIHHDVFGGCDSLTTVDLPALKTISESSFDDLVPMSAFILRGNVVPEVTEIQWGTIRLGSSIAKGTGYIYVPRALINEYKTHKYWSGHAAQFRALEDYTVDGTTTGALDPYLI